MATHKIVILETDQERRDTLKSMVSEWGYKPFIFEKESRCLDNLEPMEPDLVISCSLSVDKASRFIHTLQLTNCGVPMVIISDDQDILEFVDSNGFGDVSVIKVNSNPAEIEAVVNRALKESCDVYFYTIARRVGITKIAAMAERLLLLITRACIAAMAARSSSGVPLAISSSQLGSFR